MLGADHHPTWTVLGRTLTFSFGSICFGSAFVAFVSLLKFVVYTFHHRGPAEASSKCMQFLDNSIDTVSLYFNKHAFSYIAIYGYTFMTSARRVFNLFLLKGFQEVVAEDWTSLPTAITGLVGGSVSSGLGSLIYIMFNMDLNHMELIVTNLALFGYGFFLFTMMSSVLTSYAGTILVMWAEYPGGKFCINNIVICFLKHRIFLSYAEFQPHCLHAPQGLSRGATSKPLSPRIIIAVTGKHSFLFYEIHLNSKLVKFWLPNSYRLV